MNIVLSYLRIKGIKYGSPYHKAQIGSLPSTAPSVISALVWSLHLVIVLPLQIRLVATFAYNTRELHL